MSKWMKFKGLAKYILLIGALFGLTSCPAPGPECVYADQWGAEENINVHIDSRNEWTPAGIRVVRGEPLYMKTNGFVDICPEVLSLDVRDINPQSRVWQNSGVYVLEGDRLAIAVTGSYIDSSQEAVFGAEGLYMIISDEDPNANPDVCRDSEGDGPNDDYFYPNPRFDEDTCFMSMFDNGTVGEGAGFSGAAPREGYLWFKYARTAASRDAFDRGGYRPKESPWRGPWVYDEVNCALAATNIATTAVLCATIFPQGTNPFCIAGIAKIVADAANGFIPYEGTRRCNDCRNCLGWTMERFNDPLRGGEAPDRGYQFNANGSDGNAYRLTATRGCLGVKGRFLQAVMASPDDISQSSVPLFEPPGCVPAGENDPNCVRKEVFGVPQNTLEYSISHDLTNTIDMDGTKRPLPLNINSLGEYGSLPIRRNSPDNPNAPGSPTVLDSGELWFRLVDDRATPTQPEPTYSDNLGTYTVKVVTTKSEGFSRTLNKIINPIKKILLGYCATDENYPSVTQEDCYPKAVVSASGNVISGAWQPGLAENLYNRLLRTGVPPDGVAEGDIIEFDDSPFISALRAVMVLYIVIYGFMYMFGLLKDTQKNFIANALRYGIVQQLLDPDSWEFFNTFFFDAFTDGIHGLISIMAGDFTGAISTILVDPVTGEALEGEIIDPITGEVIRASDYTTDVTADPFAFINQTLGQFFTQETMIKIAGLIASSGTGFILAAVMFGAIFMLAITIIKAVVLYLMALIAIAILSGISPIFISFLLFERTRDLFINWIRNLISYAVQPAMVLAALAVFNVFIYSAIYHALYFDVCWQCVHEPFTLDWGALGQTEIGCLFKYYLPYNNTDLATESTVHIFLAFILLLMVSLMLKMVDWMSTIAAHVASAKSGTSLLSPTHETLGAVKTAVSSIASQGTSLARVAKDKAFDAFKAGAKNSGGK